MNHLSLPPLYKSVAGQGTTPLPLGTDVLSSSQVFSPLMVMKQSAMQHNLASMAQYCRLHGVRHAAHGKTSMSPLILQSAVDAGAWGICAATPAQVRALRTFGIKNVFLANELVDPAGIRWIAEYQRENPATEFLCYVDSLAGVALLDAALSEVGTCLSVLVEVSVPGGRTGCRSMVEAVAIAHAVKQSPYLELAGVAGYEGAIAGDRSEESLAAVRDYCQTMVSAARAIDAEALFAPGEVLLSAGGGTFFDIVVEMFAAVKLSRPTVTLIRSGAYMAHDDGLYSRLAPFAQPNAEFTFQATLEIWGRVLSRPEPGLAILDFGRRDVPFDQDLPVPHFFRDRDGSHPRTAAQSTITAVNDQHAYLSLPADLLLAVGDWVGCGISHPCTAFDKWRYLPLIDDEYRCVGDISTFF
ncbi:amino acid deaminase [Rouxiella badensis]|jgi:D-serine deaminase-like pyridoxal phosphate-dependent protein|uniref:amino acid deaminase n=1 Tax=Rouxiella badensis TaxID=1646377 RepID=UPI0003672AA4|nr:amino acid deaminase [Rouxiella badensis]QII37760.1 amino acid deaminase [Rouxiella badensis]WAT10003.1 amino acid deaminase [Rouxiella badensis]